MTLSTDCTGLEMTAHSRLSRTHYSVEPSRQNPSNDAGCSSYAQHEGINIVTTASHHAALETQHQSLDLLTCKLNGSFQHPRGFLPISRGIIGCWHDMDELLAVLQMISTDTDTNKVLTCAPNKTPALFSSIERLSLCSFDVFASSSRLQVCLLQ